MDGPFGTGIDRLPRGYFLGIFATRFNSIGKQDFLKTIPELRVLAKTKPSGDGNHLTNLTQREKP
jgi:hypothetical protein